MATGLSQQEYLEALYEMAEEGIPTQQARLAEWLNVSPASVSEAVKRLGKHGLVETGADRRLRFTAKGDRVAEALVRRHRLAERFLVEVIGLPWHLAHEEATAWGPAISERVEARLVEMLRAVAPDGTMTLEVDGEKIGLGGHLADNLWVRA
jgi:DtxR family Mn-dependent transcriptional regulator